MRAIGVEGCETNYYGIINKILEFSFARNKELKVVFFDCDWFDGNNGTWHNQFSMVEVKCNERLPRYDTFILGHQVKQVYYLPYPCQKLSAWWVVHKVTPHDTPMLDDDVDEVNQEEEFPPSFIVDPAAGLDDLVKDDDDIQMSVVVKQKWKPIKKKVWLSRLRARLLDRDADEFLNYLHVLLLFITSFILYIFC
jgi:hypothetical protein